MSNNASEKMLQAVRLTRESAARAEREYDRGAERLQMNASRSIDLFGGTAVSQVADIAGDARKICDALYASYQMLIKMLDEQCRPLLEEGPDYTAVREVRDLVKWLNDESEIENNFTASLNNRSLGGVVSGRYIPTIENKMIQAFWEAKFDMWPGRAEAEEAERRRLAELAEQRKQALLKKQQEEAAEYEKACAEYETAYAAWKEQAEAAEKQRGEAVAQKLDALSAKEAEGAVAIEEKYNDLRRAVAAQKQDYQRKKQEASAALASLGLFQFAQKKAANATIAEMDEKIAQADARLREAEVDRNEEMRQLDAWVKKEQQRIRKECDAAYPIPAAPVKPSDPRSRVSFSPTQTANAGLKDAICSGMTPGRLYTITDLQTSIPALEDLSNMRVSSLVRQLVVDGRLRRTEDKRMAYFSLADESPSVPSSARPYTSSSAPAAPTATQLANAGLKDAICSGMTPGRLYTVTDLQASIPALVDLSNARISSLVRQLVVDGRLLRTEDGCKAYFSLVD